MRLFVGLSLPDDITSHLSTLRGSLPHIYWYDPTLYHITLCFIGEIRNHNVINDFDLALEKLTYPAFEMMIKGVNCFTSLESEHNLSAYVTPTPSLLQLKKKIEHIAHNLNIKLSKIRFTPHITLAKGTGLNETQISNWLYTYNLFHTVPFQISQFSIFSSHSDKNKPHYITEATYLLR